jgi:regulatory protein
LYDKLRAKAVGDDDSRAAVIAALIDEGLLSDRRFAEAFINARRERGQGPLRIGMELRQRGIDKAIAAALLGNGEADWPALAREARRKRFGDEIPGDYTERARQARFLRFRGFTEAQVSAALGDDD